MVQSKARPGEPSPTQPAMRLRWVEMEGAQTASLGRQLPQLSSTERPAEVPPSEVLYTEKICRLGSGIRGLPGKVGAQVPALPLDPFQVRAIPEASAALLKLTLPLQHPSKTPASPAAR